MIHNMKLEPDPFDRIVAGEKKIEYRLWDEKRSCICKDDQIIFTNIITGEAVIAYVRGYIRANSFTQLKEILIKKRLIEENDFNPLEMHKYYSREDVEKYGVVGIEIEHI